MKVKQAYKLIALNALVVLAGACGNKPAERVIVDEAGNEIRREVISNPQPITDTMIVLGTDIELQARRSYNIHKRIKLADKYGHEYFYQYSENNSQYINTENVLIVEKQGDKVVGISRNLTHERIKQEFAKSK